jgi:hypothetical protein
VEEAVKRWTFSGPQRQQGWGAAEYLAILLGLIGVWRGAHAVLVMVHEYHDEFSWVLMIPF